MQRALCGEPEMPYNLPHLIDSDGTIASETNPWIARHA
jgi:hypothetical protein